MKSSTGHHYLALDHVRALAAFTVFVWHFTHAGTGYPVPFEYTPFAVPPLSLLDEGHTGVALFMTLSGYLFAKLLAHKSISYRLFIYNRALRLLPLLAIVIAIVGVIKYLQGSLAEYAKSIIVGVLLPTLPNGAWSVTVEFHFYLVLPILLFLAKKSLYYLLAIVVAAILFRSLWHNLTGSVAFLSYWTFVGRVDQFVLGMLSAYTFPWLHRNRIAGLTALMAAVCLTTLYTWFDYAGGFYHFPRGMPFSVLWIVLPTMEGLAYAAIIGWYDGFQKSTGPLSRAIGKVGEYSYSIYLLHFFVVFQVADFIHTRVMDISNLYVAIIWSLPAFLLMALISAGSYHLIELPFLKHRKNYLTQHNNSFKPKPLRVSA